MRAARSKKILNRQTGRCRTVYYGSFRYLGKQYWVPGSYETSKAWERAADEIKASVEEDRRQALAGPGSGGAPTLAQIAGATIEEKTGYLKIEWPRNHPKRRRSKQSSIRRAEEGIRELIRRFGERRPGEIAPAEAYEFLQGVGTNSRQYSAQFYDDALRLYSSPGASNPFRGHDLPARQARKNNPEFRILSNDEFDRLVAAALATRDDSYGRIQAALVIALGTSCARPSECFALRFERKPRLADGVQPSWVDFEANEIHITSQFDHKGREVLPKSNKTRVVVLPPPMREAIVLAPRLSEFVFPAVRGGRLTTGLWDAHYWPAIRAAYGDPTLEFYELKHRAITWCCTPRSSGGLGLDPATVAYQAGHNDGGLTVARHYLKLDEELARQRIREAMAAYAPGNAGPRKAPLRVVGS